MKKNTLIAISLLALSLIVNPNNVSAATCTGQYGEAVTCPEEKVLGVTHEPVNAGIGDINPEVLIGSLSLLSATSYTIARKLKKANSFSI